MSLAQFIEKWTHESYPPDPVASAADAGPGSSDQATVWVWDHDDGGVTAAADTFTLWIERFAWNTEP